MRQTIYDFYTGFEGEGEITFVRKADDHELAFTMWDGYFDTIMMAIRPGPSGWTSLALAYHVEDPWDTVPAWPVPDSCEAADQLDGIDRSGLSEREREVLERLVAFIREGVRAGDQVFIQAS